MNPRNFTARALRRIVQTTRIAYYRLISDNLPQSKRVQLLQPLFCTGLGRIELSDCHIGVQPSPRLWDGYCHIEARESSASVQVAAGVWLNNSATLIAERSSIRIDCGCLIGPAVQIFDSDFHSLNPDLRTSGNHECAPVHLEENVFLGASVIVLKGVTIGRGSVVASGSVVVRDVPPRCVVAGAPARVVRQLTTEASE